MSESASNSKYNEEGGGGDLFSVLIRVIVDSFPASSLAHFFLEFGIGIRKRRTAALAWCLTCDASVPHPGVGIRVSRCGIKFWLLMSFADKSHLVSKDYQVFFVYCYI